MNIRFAMKLRDHETVVVIIIIIIIINLLIN
jgi:hypothetical protein